MDTTNIGLREVMETEMQTVEGGSVGHDVGWGAIFGSLIGVAVAIAGGGEKKALKGISKFPTK